MMAERSKIISRATLVQLLNVAIQSQAYRFAKQAALNWLGVYPGDLGVKYLLAKVLLGEGKGKEAIEILEKLCKADPEFFEAQEALTVALMKEDSAKAIDSLACVRALGRDLRKDQKVPEWSDLLRSAWRAFKQSNLEEAESLVYRVVGLNPESRLAAVLHLRIAVAVQEDVTAHQLANLYYNRWRDCLPFAHYLAQLKMELGDEQGAVNLMHMSAVSDVAGQVAGRLWGSEHRYKPMWQERLEMNLDIPIPASIATAMGWNQLPPGEPLHPKKEVFTEGETQVNMHDVGQPIRETNEAPTETEAPLPAMDETLRAVEEVFASLADRLNQPEIGRSDGRFPYYVVLSTKGGLCKQYGDQTAGVIDVELKRLTETITKRTGWGTLILYPDDSLSCSQAGVTPVEGIDPWKLKLALGELEKKLRQKGSMIGALLIVGGTEVVPFHKLPNPTDDSDAEVASDTPYGTSDSNYFAPEWAVGRMPGELGPDAGLLLAQIRRATEYHIETPLNSPWWSRFQIITSFLRVVESFLDSGVGQTNYPSFGYSAAVWRRSSLAAFRPVGEGKDLLVSPPEAVGSFEAGRIVGAKIGYFNLHGVSDGPDWYGQRDNSDLSCEGPDYPVAINPQTIQKNGYSPKVIFSEACYGAHIYNKTIDDAMCLKFIGIGTPAFIGSTCIAYGSVTTPLIGADLLANLLWKFMREGYPIGDAMLRARVEFAREMDRRQGFLDGEDQKTLISFVLFGDPLMGIEQVGQKQITKKGVVREKSRPEVKTICDRKDENLTPKVPTATIMEVKHLLANYLPGVDDAVVTLSQQHAVCKSGGHTCPNGSLGEKVSHGNANGQVVVTLSKEVKVKESLHRHFARATINKEGKMIKLAVSR